MWICWSLRGFTRSDLGDAQRPPCPYTPSNKDGKRDVSSPTSSLPYNPNKTNLRSKQWLINSYTQSTKKTIRKGICIWKLCPKTTKVAKVNTGAVWMLWIVQSVIRLLHTFFSKTNLLTEAEKKWYSRINPSFQVRPPAWGLGTTFTNKPSVVTCFQLLFSWRLPLSEQEAGCGPSELFSAHGLLHAPFNPKDPSDKDSYIRVLLVLIQKWKEGVLATCWVQVCSYAVAHAFKATAHVRQ